MEEAEEEEEEDGENHTSSTLTVGKIEERKDKQKPKDPRAL